MHDIFNIFFVNTHVYIIKTEIFADQQLFQDHKGIALCQKRRQDQNLFLYAMHYLQAGKYDRR